jgi:DNA-binding Lrp family transcriptional regulator
MINKIIKFPPRESKETAGIGDVAKILGVSWDAVRDRVKKLYPNKIRNGVKTLLNEEEVIKIKENIKNNCVSMSMLSKNNISATLAGVETINEKSIRIVETELLTTGQLAKQFKTSSKVILANAKKCLPNKIIQNGKITYFTKEEITVLLDYIKNNPTDRPNATFTEVSKATFTDLSPILRLKQIHDEKERLYNEEIEIYRKELEKEREACQRAEKSLELTKKELQYQTLSKEKYKDLAWIEAKRGEELEEYLDKRTDRQKQRAKYVYLQD